MFRFSETIQLNVQPESHISLCLHEHNKKIGKECLCVFLSIVSEVAVKFLKNVPNNFFIVDHLPTTSHIYTSDSVKKNVLKS